MKLSPALALGLAAAFACGPALAQNSGPNSSPSPAQSQSGAQPAQTTGGPTIGTATISPSNAPASELNPLLTNGGRVQIKKALGTDIYNKENQQIGTLQDVLVGQGGQAEAVVSTNGKRVVVPWSKLQFGDAKLNSHNKVLMLGETQKSLSSMPAFNPQGQANKSG